MSGIAQKIKSALVDENGNRKHLLPSHRQQAAPMAPAAPIVEPAVTSAPLTQDALLSQREALAPIQEAPLAAEVPLANVPLTAAPAPATEFGMNNGLGLAGNRLSTGLVRAEPTILETVQKETVVHERIHPVEKEEIQPIIYREREQLDVRQITQMLHETQIQPTLIQQRELPAQTREAVVERAAPIQENVILPTREVDATLRSQVVHAPIVNEVIKKTVIEEIQPVLERDVIQSTVIQNTQPIYEKIVEAPQVYREVIVNAHERGVVAGSFDELAAQGFNMDSFSNYNQAANLNGGFRAVDGRRKSLVEALPASYGYLNENKLEQAERLETSAPVASVPLL